MEVYHIIVLNGGGYEIDNQVIISNNATNALLQYIKEYRPTLEKDDKILIKD